MRTKIGCHSSFVNFVGSYNLWHFAQLFSYKLFPAASSGVNSFAFAVSVTAGTAGGVAGAFFVPHDATNNAIAAKVKIFDFIALGFVLFEVNIKKSHMP